MGLGSFWGGSSSGHGCLLCARTHCCGRKTQHYVFITHPIHARREGGAVMESPGARQSLPRGHSAGISWRTCRLHKKGEGIPGKGTRPGGRNYQRDASNGGRWVRELEDGWGHDLRTWNGWLLAGPHGLWQPAGSSAKPRPSPAQLSAAWAFREGGRFCGPGLVRVVEVLQTFPSPQPSWGQP